MDGLDRIRIEFTPSNAPDWEPRHMLQARTIYKGQEYGAMIPLEPDPLTSDYDRYMDACLDYLKEILRRALKGETIG